MGLRGILGVFNILINVLAKLDDVEVSASQRRRGREGASESIRPRRQVDVAGEVQVVGIWKSRVDVVEEVRIDMASGGSESMGGGVASRRGKRWQRVNGWRGRESTWQAAAASRWEEES